MINGNLTIGDRVEINGNTNVVQSVSPNRLVLVPENEDVTIIREEIESHQGTEVTDIRKHPDEVIKADIEGPLLGGRGKIGKGTVNNIRSKTDRYLSGAVTIADGRLRVWFAKE